MKGPNIKLGIIILVDLVCVILGIRFWDEIKEIFSNNTALWVFIGLVIFAVVSSLYINLVSRVKSRVINKLHNNLKDYEILSKRVKKGEDVALSQLPVGIILYDEDLVISYANNFAKDAFSNILIGRSIMFIHEGLSNYIHSDSDKFIINVYGREYDVIHYSGSKILYLFDETAREETKRTLDDFTPVIGYINFDNLNEATEDLDLQHKTTVVAKFLGAIDEWCTKYQINMENITNERIVIMLNKKQLLDLMKTEFKIMNKIREISREHEIRVTLSMGIACNILGQKELGEMAEEALDIALDRGGDQVVINMHNEPLKYYGGKSNTVEKRTKVNAKINSRILGELIENADNVVIMPHKSADVDAFGAAIGLLRIAESMKKEVKIVLPYDQTDATVQKVLTLANKEYIRMIEYIVDADDAYEMVNPNTLLIVVDHHTSNLSIDPRLLKKTANIAIILLSFQVLP